MFASVSWQELFSPDLSLLQIFIRGTVTYLVLFTLLRVVLKRETGTLGTADLLVIVLIADASQNAMAGEYKSITDGLALVATLLFWSHTLNLLGYKVPLIGRLVHPPPLLLIQEGREIRRNLAQELITHEELMSQLRRQGVEELGKVKRAWMEGSGEISVVSYKPEEKPGPPKRRGV